MLCVITAGGSGTKPPSKGVDMDAVGNINGVPAYEFDLDGLKVEDKPWRKPGINLRYVMFFHCFLFLHLQSKQVRGLFCLCL